MAQALRRHLRSPHSSPGGGEAAAGGCVAQPGGPGSPQGTEQPPEALRILTERPRRAVEEHMLNKMYGLG